MTNLFLTLTLFAKCEIFFDDSTLFGIMGFLSFVLVVFAMIYGPKIPDKINSRMLTGLSVALISILMALLTSIMYNHYFAGTKNCNSCDAIVDEIDDIPPFDNRKNFNEDFDKFKDSINNVDKERELDRKAKIMMESMKEFEKYHNEDSIIKDTDRMDRDEILKKK